MRVPIERSGDTPDPVMAAASAHLLRTDISDFANVTAETKSQTVESGESRRHLLNQRLALA